MSTTTTNDDTNKKKLQWTREKNQHLKQKKNTEATELQREVDEQHKKIFRVKE